MTLVLRELERLERRVLAGLRCIDAGTRVPIESPLQVRIPGARVQRNRSGLYVIAQADALAAHESAFDQPPGLPGLESVTLQVSIEDPAGRYLPRRIDVLLPRDPARTQSGAPGPLFRPIDVPLYPAATATVGANWAVLRATLSAQSGGDALGGALFLVRANNQVLARALTDWRGEALVPVVGVPVTTWSDDPHVVVVSELAAQLEWVFDPAAGIRTPAAAVREGRAPAALPLVDPDALETHRLTLPHGSQAVTLAAGRSQSLPSLTLALP